MGARGLFVLILASAAPVAAAPTLREAEAQSARAWQALPTLPTAPPQSSAGPSGEETSDLKSPWAAVGLSLLLPGAGHFYADAPGRGRFFVGAEAAILSLALVFDRRDAWKSEDAVDYAVAHAQLNPDGKDDEFLERLEFYQDRDEYNTAGRIIDPARPYIPETPDTYWQWDDPANREVYRGLRNASDAAERNRTFALLAAVLNRVVASVDAFRHVHGHNARRRDQEGLRISLESSATPRDPRILLHAQFDF